MSTFGNPGNAYPETESDEAKSGHESEEASDDDAGDGPDTESDSESQDDANAAPDGASVDVPDVASVDAPNDDHDDEFSLELDEEASVGKSKGANDKAQVQDQDVDIHYQSAEGGAGKDTNDDSSSVQGIDSGKRKVTENVECTDEPNDNSAAKQIDGSVSKDNSEVSKTAAAPATDVQPATNLVANTDPTELSLLGTPTPGIRPAAAAANANTNLGGKRPVVSNKAKATALSFEKRLFPLKAPRFSEKVKISEDYPRLWRFVPVYNSKENKYQVAGGFFEGRTQHTRGERYYAKDKMFAELYPLAPKDDLISDSIESWTNFCQRLQGGEEVGEAEQGQCDYFYVRLGIANAAGIDSITPAPRGDFVKKIDSTLDAATHWSFVPKFNKKTLEYHETGGYYIGLSKRLENPFYLSIRQFTDYLHDKKMQNHKRRVEASLKFWKWRKTRYLTAQGQNVTKPKQKAAAKAAGKSKAKQPTAAAKAAGKSKAKQPTAATKVAGKSAGKNRKPSNKTASSSTVHTRRNPTTIADTPEMGGSSRPPPGNNSDPNRFLQYDSSLVNPYPQRYGDMNCISLTICSLLYYWEEAGPTVAKRYFDLYGKDIEISIEMTQKKVSTVLPNVALRRLRPNEFNVYTWPVIVPTVVYIENDLEQSDHCMGILGDQFFDSCNNFTLPRRPECANHICRPNKYKRFTFGFQLIVKEPTRNEKVKLARKRRREKAKAGSKHLESEEAFAGTSKKKKRKKCQLAVQED